MTVTGSTFTQIDNDGIDIEINRGDGSLVVDGSTADGTNTFSQINGRSITFGSTADNAANGVLRSEGQEQHVQHGRNRRALGRRRAAPTSTPRSGTTR